MFRSIFRVGYEVRVNEADARAWVGANRPSLKLPS